MKTKGALIVLFLIGSINTSSAALKQSIMNGGPVDKNGSKIVASHSSVAKSTTKTPYTDIFISCVNSQGQTAIVHNQSDHGCNFNAGGGQNICSQQSFGSFKSCSTQAPKVL